MMSLNPSMQQEKAGRPRIGRAACGWDVALVRRSLAACERPLAVVEGRSRPVDLSPHSSWVPHKRRAARCNLRGSSTRGEPLTALVEGAPRPMSRSLHSDTGLPRRAASPAHSWNRPPVGAGGGFHCCRRLPGGAEGTLHCCRRLPHRAAGVLLSSRRPPHRSGGVLQALHRPPVVRRVRFIRSSSFAGY